ncbi:MAG: MurT ligase domain-containing protein [Actinomycetota bacterium]|nr:MurT ligase domain-containing protein [Actinomycetota bacterium]
MLSFLAVSLGKSLRFLLRLVRRGGGSALPGLIASFLSPNLLRNALARLPEGVVLVSGSAGKSSTTNTLVKLLEAHGLQVFNNPSTANIKQGLFSAVLKEGDLLGRIDYDIAVLEVDEGHGSALLKDLSPRLVVLTNVLSDQLDRFVDPDFVIGKLGKLAQAAKESIINAHDPNLRSLKLENIAGAVCLAKQLEQSLEAPSYALRFDSPEQIDKCSVISGTSPMVVDVFGSAIELRDPNLPHALNTSLALVATYQLVKFDPEIAQAVVDAQPAVFARNELTEIEGKRVNLRLVQNPTSFQLNVDELTQANSPLMLMAGSDIHDPSWLWTVDFTSLRRVDIVSGSNAYDLALRLSYAGVEIGAVLTDLSEAKNAFLSLEGELPTILFSADSMRRLRRLTGLAK